MDQDGGTKRFPDNKAGAKYGTGYCDAQCPTDLKFINGLANVENWKGQDNDKNSGNGRYGACCAEMDIWESNSQATAYTAHPCTVNSEYRCDSNGKECGGFKEGRDQGVCDQDGCDFNSYRMGDKTFWGPGLTVDSNKPMTVVTQFVGSPVTEIKRKYVQGGKVIDNSNTNISGITAANSLTDKFCKEAKVAFGDTDAFTDKGGMAQFAKSLSTGVVLVLSLWDDHAVNMLWLDSSYPTDKSGPGIERGPCATSTGVPADVESKYASASVIYGNIKFGPIDSTY
jgi:cellulose 1,4-beta-cellobiosidase